MFLIITLVAGNADAFFGAKTIPKNAAHPTDTQGDQIGRIFARVVGI
jgi:hypothetical protein